MAYDVIVLGGGPGGYFAAERAGHAGLKTAVIENRALGGTCLNEGCIPSKVLLNSSKIFHYTTPYGALYGVNATGTIDQAKVIERRHKVTATLVAGVGATMKANHVEVINANAQITGRNAEGLVTVEAAGKTYETKNLIIATGSKASVPPIPGLREQLDAGFVVTNLGALDMKVLPKSMAVMGGGVIGLELAAYYMAVGVEVTIIEMMNKIAGPIDAELSTLLQKNYAKEGMKFLLGAKIVRVEADGVVYEKDGKEAKCVCEKVLCAIGRRPVSDTCGIEKLNITTERGAICVDDCMRTNAVNVYAVGDCNGKSMLAHSAYREADVAVNTILGRKDRMRYKAIPSVLYGNPEISCVGLTEEQAKAKGIDAVTVKLPMQYAGRYVAENEGGNGIAKFVFDKKYRTLIGAHIMSNYSSEFIVAIAIMIEQEMTVDAIREIVYPHPSVAEIIKEAAFAAPF